MKSLIFSFLVLCSSFFPKHASDYVNCRFADGHFGRVESRFCHTPKPSFVPTPRPSHKPKPTKTPTPTPIPTPTPSPTPSITNVVTHLCTQGSSCYGFLTSVEVFGVNFGTDSRAKLLNLGNEYTGTYMGGNGSTNIITDFINLPQCTTFDLQIFGSTGTATSAASVSSYCP